MIKKTGMIRKIDELGRVVIPIELRNLFKYNEKDPIEVYMRNKEIVLKKPVLDGNEKNVGIIRKFDELGRITLPKELRDRLGMEIKSPVEIYINGKDIILRRYETSCTFCDTEKNLNEFKGKQICAKCLDKIKNI